MIVHGLWYSDRFVFRYDESNYTHTPEESTILGNSSLKENSDEDERNPSFEAVGMKHDENGFVISDGEDE
tara:strand:+ start:214 stop:423 length:210 start_codon:yes stop_codon:yes gene_type:complete